MTQPKKKINVAVLLIVASVMITVPLLVALGVILWLDQTSFTSVDELKVQDLDTIRIELKNLASRSIDRPDTSEDKTNTMDRTDADIRPVYMTRPDFNNILAPLREATPIDPKEWPASAYLGKYEIKYKDGRGGTIMLYWNTEIHGNADSPGVVWMKIGGNRYQACKLKELRTVAEECAKRGTLK
jgi:hypothetical protein